MAAQRGSVQTYVGTLVTEECSECHIIYAMPQAFQEQCRAQGPKMTFYCPRGHAQCYTVSEISRLRNDLTREQVWRKSAEARAVAAHDQATAAERSRAAYKGQLTKVRKRIGNGTCPCCNRHFTNVERHMSTQHPGYAETEQAL